MLNGIPLLHENGFIIRHAKSDWSIDGQTDIDRALNARGYNDAHNVGKAMKGKVKFLKS